ncbi:MAG: AzlC family ABC transporter permease, partial [Desulfobulbus sp.]
MKHDFKDGFFATIPISFSIVSFGLVCGALSAQNGMTLFELLLMNVFVFGGAGQFLMVEMWGSPLDVLGISMAALLINLRYFLMCMALHPLFTYSRMIEKLTYIHLIAEPNWALSLSRLEAQPTSPLFLFGGGVCMLFAWSAGTVSGFFLGASLSNPAVYGLDFALIAMIIT